MKQMIGKAMLSIQTMFIGRRLHDVLMRHKRAADRLDQVVRSVMDPPERS